jgi:hypothetical protein
MLQCNLNHAPAGNGETEYNKLIMRSIVGRDCDPCDGQGNYKI